MKTGIFGGAFNPVHNGHLNLAGIYLNKLSLDRIIFIPTYKPPHKTDAALAGADDRINMLELALTDKRYEISAIEFEREEVSYTYDTLKQLKELYPNDSFYLIIGSDQFFYFDKWYRYKDILNMVNLCSFSRGSNPDERAQMISYAEKVGIGNYTILDLPPVRLSSSEIRDKIKNGESITGLVPEDVEKYITEKGLYIV